MKASVNSAFTLRAIEGLWYAVDPKQGELPMSRVNASERMQEARTVEPFKTLG